MVDKDDMTDQSVKDFVTATAAKAPTPGGGSVAGVVGALGTALGEMALVFTRGKKAFAAHEADYQAIAERMAEARGRFLALVAEDMNAYARYQQATRTDAPDKQAKVQAALAAAIGVPREMAGLCLAVLADLASLLNRCNKWLITDLAAGAVLAEAVVRLCDYNVRINVPDCGDPAVGAELLASSTRDCQEAGRLVAEIERGAKQQLQPPQTP